MNSASEHVLSPKYSAIYENNKTITEIVINIAGTKICNYVHTY